MRAAGWLLAGGDPASPGPPWIAQDAEITASVAADARILTNPLRAITLCLSMPEFRALHGHRLEIGPWRECQVTLIMHYTFCAAGPRLMHPSQDTLFGSPPL